MEKKAQLLAAFIREQAATRGKCGVLVQASSPDAVEAVRRAAEMLIASKTEEDTLHMVAVSIQQGLKCSAVTDALHLPGGFLVHVDPECICCLGNENVVYYSTASGAEMASEQKLLAALRSLASEKQADVPYDLSACIGSAAFLRRAQLSEEQMQALQNTKEIRARLAQCLGTQFTISSLRRKLGQGERLGIIVADTGAETLRAARLLKEALWADAEEQRIRAFLFYFGPRLDEAKLLNAEASCSYVLVSGCRAAAAPWLNRGFQKASGSVKICTLFEFLTQNKRLEFDGFYETELGVCLSALEKWKSEANACE